MHLSVQVSAQMEMQQFYPTTGFDCDQDTTGIDDCVLQQSLKTATCRLPFQQQPTRLLRVCQNPEEGWAAFQQFQLAAATGGACRPPCTQLTTTLHYSWPLYLQTCYLPTVTENFKEYAYYLTLPPTIKVSTTLPSYSFVSYIAEVAGWYNLFLGGSVLALWEGLWAALSLWSWLHISPKKLGQLTPVLTVLVIVAAGGVLIYILMDCVTQLVDKPIGTSTMLRTSLTGLSLSVCLPRFTYIFNVNAHKDVANTTDFWARGNNLSNKVAELSVRRSEGGDWVTLWNRTGSAANTSQLSLFQVVNVIRSTTAVYFCHSLDLSALPYRISQVLIRAVDDVALFVHLAGQLLKSQGFYEIANMDTLKVPNNNIDLYGSEVSLQLEETSFLEVSSADCDQYNTTWTFDNCLLDTALMRIEVNKQDLLRGLLNGTTVEAGIEKTFLQDFYSVLLSQAVERSCQPDCRSLVVQMTAEASTVKAMMPTGGIPRLVANIPKPLPPISVNVNLTMPELSQLNQVNKKS